MSVVRVHPGRSRDLIDEYASASVAVRGAVAELSPLVSNALALLDQPGQHPLYGPLPALNEVAVGMMEDGRDLDWRLDLIVTGDARPIAMSGMVRFDTNNPAADDPAITLVDALIAAGLTTSQAQAARRAIHGGTNFYAAVDEQNQHEFNNNMARFRRMEAEAWTERSPVEQAEYALDQIRLILDTAREDKDDGDGIGQGGGQDGIWSTNDLHAVIENRHGFYTEGQIEHALTVLAMAQSSPEARDHLGITQSDGGWSFTDIAHLTLDIVGMVPVVGNAADGINAAWYAAEGDYLNAALSSLALVPAVGQAVTIAKPAILAASAGVVFKSLDEALAFARRWLDEAGILGRSADEAGSAAAHTGDDFLYRGDNSPFSPSGRAADGVKSHIDPDTGDLLPANPNGNADIHQHVRGAEPAKSDSPFTSMTDSGEIAANYGDQTVIVDRARLEADIAAGRVNNVEVVSPREVQEALQVRVADAQARFDANPTSRNADRLERTRMDLDNARSDSEYLINGVVPGEYVVLTSK